MEKQELYHFHKTGKYDKLWQADKKILVPENFKSDTFKRVQSFSTVVNYDEQTDINLYDLISRYFYYNENVEQISRQDLLKLLKISFAVSFKANEFKRETALENYRLNNVNDLPSRLHSIYLTDEKGVDGWKDKFGSADLELYRVEVEGNIFKTNEQFIPDERLSYQEVYDSAYSYWHPNFKKVPDNCNEYLSQGKIKVLEKIENF